jgi:hypothetical protein
MSAMIQMVDAVTIVSTYLAHLNVAVRAVQHWPLTKKPAQVLLE